MEVGAVDHPKTSLMIVSSSLETTDGNLYLHIPMKMDLQPVTSALNLLKSTSVGFKTEGFYWAIEPVKQRTEKCGSFITSVVSSWNHHLMWMHVWCVNLTWPERHRLVHVVETCLFQLTFHFFINWVIVLWHLKCACSSHHKAYTQAPSLNCLQWMILHSDWKQTHLRTGYIECKNDLQTFYSESKKRRKKKERPF